MQDDKNPQTKIAGNLVTEKTAQKRFPFASTFILLLIIAFALLTALVKIYPYLEFDLAVTLAIQQIDLPFLSILMRFISELGNTFIEIISILTATLVALILRNYRTSLIIAISSVGAIVLSIFLKALVERPRPDPHVINQIGEFLKNDSFPSGHVLYFIGLYGFLIFFIHTHFKIGLLRSFLLTLFTLMIILIGVSRIYLGAHWFSDTLGSYLIGTVWLYLMVYIYKKIHAP